MKWIVIKDTQVQPALIAVVATSENRKLKIEKYDCLYYNTKQEAVAEALRLKAKLNIVNVKIFNPEL